MKWLSYLGQPLDETYLVELHDGLLYRYGYAVQYSPADKVFL